MANWLITQLMFYSLLLAGYILLRRYLTNSPQEPNGPSPFGADNHVRQENNVEELASAIIELTESMEYVQNHMYHIPPEDEEIMKEAKAWMSQAQSNLDSLLVQYVQHRQLDLTNQEFLEVEDRRGRKVRITLQTGAVKEFPDEIGYQEQQEVLKNLEL